MPADRPSRSPRDAVIEVRHPRGLHRAELFKPYLGANAFQQSLAFAEDHRGEVQMELVEQTGGEVLTDGAGSTGDQDVLVARRLARLLESGFDSVGCEVEGRASHHLHRLALVVGEDEDRGVVGRIVAPPARPGAVLPRAANRAEHVAPHDEGADVGVHLLGGLGARIHLSALLTVRLAPGLQREHPLVELFASLTEGVVLALIRSGYIAVERDRSVGSHLAHRFSSVDALYSKNSSDCPGAM